MYNAVCASPKLERKQEELGHIFRAPSSRARHAEESRTWQTLDIAERALQSEIDALDVMQDHGGVSHQTLRRWARTRQAVRPCFAAQDRSAVCLQHDSLNRQ